MNRQGPPLSILLQRLAETPTDFLKHPLMIGSTVNGSVNTAAVVADLLRDAGEAFEDERTLDIFIPENSGANRSHLGLVLVTCHLLHDRWFLEQGNLAPGMLEILTSGHLISLAKIVRYERFVDDPERREELARYVLHSLGFNPEGEKDSVAADRLKTMDSLERKRIIDKTREAQERARKLREEMERKEAEEAASKMSRE